MEIHYSRRFKKQYKKLPSKAKKQFAVRFGLFLEDPRDPRLHIHKLTGKLEGLWSFNVSGDIRVVVDRETPNILLLVAIGSHSELYE